ncbi:MAG: hypothetical protein KJ556_21295, partial [Gammaproteobacteria bacterium]|nr:hypothetical protein [Gammaproteobacteria bacterium]
NEAKAHGTAWAAVKTKYRQNDEGNWVAKESKEEIMPKEALSVENKRVLLQAALHSKFPNQDNWGPYVEDMTDTDVIFNQAGTTYRVPYAIGEDETVVLGVAQKVVKQTVYTAVESLQSKYAELIQESAKRSADSTRLKTVIDLCQDILSSDKETPVEVIEVAIGKVDGLLLDLKEQRAMKTEDGAKFPSEAYAYVPDREKPSTWKLRLWEDPTKKVTRRQLGAAAAALSPGGFRGQKVDIPSSDLPAVKRKIRAAYRSLEVADEDMPRWVKEAELRREIREAIEIPIEEVTREGLAKGILPVRILRPGFNESKARYYTDDAVASVTEVLDGVQMFANHQTKTEERERPEGDIRDWVAVLETSGISQQGNAVGMAKIHAPWFKEMLAGLYEQGTLEKLGVSINAVGRGVKGQIEGVKTLIVEGITGGRSVDFVTLPGAGGVAGLKEAVLLTEADDSLAESDVELVSLATLKNRRPDLVKTIESDMRAEILKEVKGQMELEEQVKELEGKVDTLTTENEDLKGKLTEADKAKAVAEAQATIKEAVDKAELPDAAKERLLERFKDSDSPDGLEEAIQSEKDYIAKLSESGKVRNLGETKVDPEKSKQSLKESFIRSGMTEAQAEIAAQGR